ncbi:O-antigen ligase family protein [Niallia nealsonii]|uniref:O-antigen ligase-related domain-containing protein n=1 Tax=Niallia nealsonii TaxID=115979 RepID=A0A2N0Z2I8_9BACI|nr:O-antigen ligase family protein [Niallia nealsonii]PKG23714.1 hypothetical protein CWS01_10245 [Niallia nealsonii]
MINFLFFLKPIFDMLWQYKVLDLLLICLLFLFLLQRMHNIKLNITSFIMLTFSLFILRSFFAKVDYSTLSILLKIGSALLIFFAAQFNKTPNKTTKLIESSYIIPVITIILLALFGKGYVLWGNALTFVGPYFYKTDLAIAIVLSIIFFRNTLFHAQSKILKFLVGIYIFGLAPFLILEANSRMFLIILGIFYIMIIIELTKYTRRKLNKSLTRILIGLSVVGLISGYSIYDNYFKPDDALEIKLSTQDIFSLSNTQGRSGIWEAEITHFKEAEHPFFVLFGFYIDKDVEFNTYSANGFDAHNSYLKVLINFGVFGLCTYLLFLVLIYIRLSKLIKENVSDKEKYNHLMTIQMVFIFFLISGLTQSNLVYTQSSWYAFYFMGLLFNPYLFNLKNKVNTITTKSAGL